MCPPASPDLLASLPMSGLTHDQLLMLANDNVADPALPGLSRAGRSAHADRAGGAVLPRSATAAVAFSPAKA